MTYLRGLCAAGISQVLDGLSTPQLDPGSSIVVCSSSLLPGPCSFRGLPRLRWDDPTASVPKGVAMRGSCFVRTMGGDDAPQSRHAFCPLPSFVLLGGHGRDGALERQGMLGGNLVQSA
jgi:hypothetical protein